MAAENVPLPRIPQALARHQEALPLVPVRKTPIPKVLGIVISLRAMCCKWWIERVQYILRRETSKPKLFALHRYVTDLPRDIRTHIVHNGLKAGGLHLHQGSREIPAVNRALVFLTSDIKVYGTIYLTLPKQGPDGVDWPPDLELILRQGEGLTKLVLNLPIYVSDLTKRIINDFSRTCKKLINVTIHNANDDVLTIITRHCQDLQKLDVSGSSGVTDEGISRAVVNLRWLDDRGSSIRHFDIDHTSTTQEGLIQLITRLPSLTSLGSSDVIEALEAVAAILGEETFETNLEEVNLKNVTVNRLKMLRKYCPKITYLKTVYQENPGATLNDLRLIKCLNKIEIAAREPFLLTPSHFHDLSWAIGPRLLKMKISGDVFWETDLGILAAQCPFVQELALPAVTFPAKESIAALMAKDSPALRFLVELEIDCMSGVGPKAWAKDFNLSRQGLVLALRRCHRLRRLVLRPTSLVDTDLLDILSENRLEWLETLEFYNSTLGLESAKLLVDTCVNLHLMKGLKTWRGMTLHELIMLRQYTRGHKRVADLKILP